MATSVRNIILEVAGETRQAQRSIGEVARTIRELPEGATLDIETRTTEALASIDKMHRELSKLDRERATPEVQVATSRALVELSAISAALEALPDDKEIDVEVRGRALRDLARVEQQVIRLTGALSKADQPAQTVGDALGNMAVVAKSVTPVLNGLTVLIGAKLVAGLIAVGASAAAAVAGVGALGAALAAAAGPAVVLVIGVMSRLAKVMEALKAQDDARDASSRKSAAGSAAAAQAAERRRGAEAQLADALRGSEAADAALAEARRQATEAIEQAEQASADATRDLADAQRGMREAGTQAFRELQDAAEEASDAIRGVEEAQLSLDEARLSVEEAVLDLKEFRQEAGAAGSALDAAFRKFSDVDVDFDSGALRDALAGAGVEDPRQQIELERRILAVRRAKENEERATDDLSDAERRNTRAREDNVELQRRGAEGTDTYIAAQRRLEEATRRAGEAEDEAQRLRDLGIDKAPAVVAALEAQRDARDRLASARAARATAIAPGTTDAEERARQKTAELTDAEERFLNTLKRVRTELSGFLTPALDSVFGAMDRALGRAPDLLNPLRDAFDGLGDAVGDVIDKLSGDLVTEESVDRIRSFVRASERLTRVLGGDALSSAAGFFGDIAEIAMPRLEDLADRLATGLEGLDAQGQSAKTVDTVNKAVDSTEAWIDLLVALGGLWASVTRNISGEGNELVKWLAEGVEKLTAWMDSAEGQEQIREFFEDTVPSVKAIAKFLGLLVLVALRFLQFVSPAIEGFVNVLNDVLGVLADILGWLNDIASNPVGRAIRYAIGQFLGFGTVLRLIGLVGGAIGRFGGTLRGLGNRIGDWVVGPFKAAFRFLDGLFGGVGSRIIGRLITGLRTGQGRVVRTGRNILVWIRDGIGRGWGIISGLGLRVGFWIVRGVERSAGRVVALGGRLITWVRRGINAGAQRVISIGGAIITGFVQGVRGASDRVVNAVRDVFGGIVRVVRRLLDIRSPSRVFKGIGENVVAGFVEGIAGSRGQIIRMMEHAFGPDVWKTAAAFVEKGIGLLDILGAPNWAKYLFGDPREWDWTNEGKSVIPHFGYRRLEVSNPVLGWQAKAGEIAAALTGRSGAMILAKLGLQAGGEMTGRIRRALIDEVGGLAAGGLVRGPVVRAIGEGTYNEAVVPLSRRVMGQLAGAITGQMSQMPLPATARAPLAAQGAGAGGGQVVHIDKVVLPAAPEGGVMDPRYAAVLFAQEMARRGGGTAGGIAA